MDSCKRPAGASWSIACNTAGDEPTGNTRAEIEVGVLKNATHGGYPLSTAWQAAVIACVIPGRRPGGEDVSAAVRTLQKFNLGDHEELEVCQGCGFKKRSKEMERKMCETPTQKDLVKKTILEGIKGIAKEMEVMSMLRQGFQQVIADEVAMSISNDSQAETCIKQGEMLCGLIVRYMTTSSSTGS